MSKEYKFCGKKYQEAHGKCKDCAFFSQAPSFCKTLSEKYKFPNCPASDIIFIAKAKATITKNPKHSWGVKPENKTEISRFIVCLTENSKLAPADIPKIHPTRASAEKEAERLCKLYHQEFVVLQVVSSVKPQEPKKEAFA